MKQRKEVAFALAMATLLQVSVSEMVDAQNAFVDDFKKEARV